jgi:TPR repeat protein
MLLEQASDNYTDYQKAIGYIKKAADNGSAVAQYDYAENLRLGLKIHRI